MIEDYEEFSESQIKILDHFVTNVNSNIFVLRNLPEVIKGALFSRYSRSTLGLRSLLLKEFILNEETAFESIVGKSDVQEDNKTQDQLTAIKKAQNFYDRILDGYGDDSIGELGGAHLAIENVSMLAAKEIEDCRIGGSPLEKSTRYIYFDQKVKGDYLFYREPILMTSAYRDLYLDTCNMLFETYGKLIPPLTELIGAQFPKTDDISKVAYTAALRAKVLDCLRGLLPAGTLTNMGLFGNGRFFETLIQKLHVNNLAESQDIGRKTFVELAKVIPSFIRRSEIGHRHQATFAQFYESMATEIKLVTKQHTSFEHNTSKQGVTLINHTPNPLIKIAAALLFRYSDKSLSSLEAYCGKLTEDELERILDSACNMRENRRHKSPRALENVSFTFEIVADFGNYRDLQRHRMLTQDRQILNCDYGYFIPQDILGTPFESDYRNALEKAKAAFDMIVEELPEEAQYIVPMAYNLRWYFHVNLRALQWLCELRSSPQGHPGYRFIAQEMARQVMVKVPALERFFKFVNFDGFELGRLEQEQRKAEKLQKHHV